MKGRVIVIDMPADRPSQAALLVDGRLEDLLIDPLKDDTAPGPGEIYWAKIDRLVPKMGGAFVTLAPGEQAFLREAKGLKEGAGVLVQVTGHPDPGKATPATTRLLYKGRRVIHTPDAPGINVSRQIKDKDERQRLIGIVESWRPDPETTREPVAGRYAEMLRAGGFIIRSAALGADAVELDHEVGRVLAQRSEREGLTRSAEPGTTAAGGMAIDAALREWTSPPVPRIVIGEAAARFVLARTNVMRRCSADIEAAITVDDSPDPFDHFGILDEIEKLKSPRVDLPSGGWMAIEATRAMVTVDVNTGDQFSGGAAITANIEAVRELPRQLRLRGLGGQITIDFAPLKKMHRKQIEEALKTAFRRDPIATTLAGWTPLGNFELQRKRERRPLTELL